MSIIICHSFIHSSYRQYSRVIFIFDIVLIRALSLIIHSIIIPSVQPCKCYSSHLLYAHYQLSFIHQSVQQCKISILIFSFWALPLIIHSFIHSYRQFSRVIFIFHIFLTRIITRHPFINLTVIAAVTDNQ